MKKIVSAIILPNIFAVILFTVFCFGKTNSPLLPILLSTFTTFIAGYIARKNGWFYGIISFLFPIIMTFLVYLLLLYLDPQNAMLTSVKSMVKTNIQKISILSIFSIIVSALLGLMGEKLFRRAIKG